MRIALRCKFTDWREMKTGKIDYDLQNSPLKIRTDSPFGSGDEVKLTFLGLDNKAAGGLRIKLDTTLEYYLSDCDNSYIDVPTSLPSSLLTEGRKIWKITKTPEPGIIVHCNEHEILKIQLSDTVCTNQKKWSESWSRQAKKIQFNSYFREYDYYYHPTGKYLAIVSSISKSGNYLIYVWIPRLKNAKRGFPN